MIVAKKDQLGWVWATGLVDVGKTWWEDRQATQAEEAALQRELIRAAVGGQEAQKWMLPTVLGISAVAIGAVIYTATR